MVPDGEKGIVACTGSRFGAGGYRPHGKENISGKQQEVQSWPFGLNIGALESGHLIWSDVEEIM